MLIPTPSEHENIYLHGLNLLPQFGPKRLLKIFNFFGNFTQAFHASLTEFTAAGIEIEAAQKFIELRKNINLDLEHEKLTKEKIKVLSFQDANYPELLREISGFPPILYYKGSMDSPDELALAVVGTRKITSYGKSTLPFILEPLLAQHITIVSGLAYGVDSTAHQLAVQKGCRTIALLGSGVDSKSIYPKDHTLLAEDIIATGGAILSEYPPGTPALKQHFIARNRIISGLSVGTLVVECDLRSGTLITVGHALDQNRQVYAIPGPIYASNSQGPNNIIKMGGKLVTEAADILSDLHIDAQNPQNTSNTTDTKEEAVIMKLLSNEPLYADTLIQSSSLTAGQVTTALTFLEMKGKIKNIGGGQYIRLR